MQNKRQTIEIAPPAELFAVLREYNPWWDGIKIPDLPQWQRAAFGEFMLWLTDPPAPRAVMLTGARQVGKTTLLLQAATRLVQAGVPPGQILYATFDHPLLKLVGVDAVLKLWRQMKPRADGPEYLLLDEVQNTTDWAVWLKHQTDFHRSRRVAVTGSALPLVSAERESGVGRWHTIKLPTLSFAEYLQIKRIPLPPIPEISSLTEVFEWPEQTRVHVAGLAEPLVAHFHEYLLRGGFPQTAQVADIRTAQKLLREDIVDKVLKRDMTALYGVRRILELEKVFLYLCLHDGGLLDLQALSSNLQLAKKTVANFIDLLEAAHLIYKLGPFGYGKEVLRARSKVYLADAAIPGSVLLWGPAMLEHPERLGAAVETAFFKHVFARYYTSSIGFSYWRGKQDREVDIVTEFAGRIIPFEIKYAHNTGPDDLKGLKALCQSRRVPRAYFITRNLSDFSVETIDGADQPTLVARVPAPLACYWLSRTELKDNESAEGAA